MIHLYLQLDNLIGLRVNHPLHAIHLIILLDRSTCQPSMLLLPRSHLQLLFDFLACGDGDQVMRMPGEVLLHTPIPAVSQLCESCRTFRVVSTRMDHIIQLGMFIESPILLIF